MNMVFSSGIRRSRKDSRTNALGVDGASESIRQGYSPKQQVRRAIAKVAEGILY
jgi:hypothetical protein